MVSAVSSVRFISHSLGTSYSTAALYCHPYVWRQSMGSIYNRFSFVYYCNTISAIHTAKSTTTTFKTTQKLKMKLFSIFAITQLTSAASISHNNNRQRSLAHLIKNQSAACAHFIRRNANNHQVINLN